MPYGYDQLAEVLDVLAEIADTPEIFNALSAESRVYLLSQPGLPPANPASNLRQRTLKVFDAAANVVSEILNAPAISDNLKPTDREFLWNWFTGGGSESQFTDSK